MSLIPKAVITRRKFNDVLYNAAIEAGATVLQSTIIANRNIPSGTDIQNFMNPSLNNIPDIRKLKDIQKAGSRIADAIITGEKICVACDFDVDGISSAAVLYKAIVDLFGHPSYLVDVCISNRMTEGYGFSDKVVDRILEKSPVATLVITADQGSSNGEQVTKYIEATKLLAVNKKADISTVGDVIISDHHEIPEKGGPKDAYAFVNPQRKDDDFPDKTICGCTVAMFLMAATRTALIKKSHLTKESPSIKSLMAYSTAATISDCVSMASGINRAIVRHGLQEINNESLPAWKVMKDLMNKKSQAPIVAESIAFGLGPMINACSRTGGDGMNAVRYYLADNEDDALRYLSFLNVDNQLRKDIEKRLVEDSSLKAVNLIEEGYHSLVIPLKNGHHGIHGIAASRLVERFGRPTILLSPKETKDVVISKEEAELLTGVNISMNKLEDFYDIPNTSSYVTHSTDPESKKKKIIFIKKTILSMSGSGRSIDGLGEDQKGELNLLKCLIESDNNYNEKIFIGYGGHHMAAGMAIKTNNVASLRSRFEESVTKYVGKEELYPKIWTDGAIPNGYELNESFLEEINMLEPYGRQFDYPAFTIEALVADMKSPPIGPKQDTGKFELIYKDSKYTAIWFKMILNPFYEQIKVGERYRFVVQPKFNYFNGKKTIQFMINYVENI